MKRSRFSLRLSPFTSFPFSQARKPYWPEDSLWHHGPTCIVGQVICLGPRSHLYRRSGYLPGTAVPPVSSVRLSAWDRGPTCLVGQIICLGPRSHLHRRSDYLPGTTVPPVSSVRLSAWDRGPTCIVGQHICLGPRSHLHRQSAYLPGTTVPPGRHRIVFKFADAGSHITQNDICHGSPLRQVICMLGKVTSGGKSRLSFRRSETGNRQLLPAGGICR